MKQHISEDLLIKYLLGEGSPDEALEVETWVAAHSANARKLDEMKSTLATSHRLAQVSPIDEKEAWVRFKSKRGPVVNQPVELLPAQVYSKWISIAAAVLVVIGAGITAYLYSDKNDASPGWVTLQADDQVRIDTLPDGSVVHINKRSSLVYPADFKTGRLIKLTGEAFFDVKHNDAIPFTVQAGDVQIQDIGTTFNIKNKAHHVEIIVGSGIVKVSRNKEAVQLHAQQMVSIKAGDKGLKVEKNSDELYNYYMSNSFAANNTPLWRLIDVLNEAYGADIKIENVELRNIPITATIKLQDSLANILNLIGLINPHMQVQKAGGTYIIK
jgi:ferric-dicitrate binding protein FerR (iron transport regulator)